MVMDDDEMRYFLHFLQEDILRLEDGTVLNFCFSFVYSLHACFSNGRVSGIFALKLCNFRKKIKNLKNEKNE